MTFEDLEVANAVKDQLRELETVVDGLRRSVEDHETNSKAFRFYERIFRFVNYKRRFEDTERAGIFLFNGMSIHGIEIPVDQEICEGVLKIFEAKLEAKKKEFAAIGGNGQ